MTITAFSIYVFCISLALLFYTYLGYSLLAGFFALFRPKPSIPPQYAQDLPISIIIPAYNESMVLVKKVNNTLEGLRNFKEAQIIVITDGSEDGSKDLVFNDPRILHLHEPERLGKSGAINKAMQKATGEIVIITDANAMVNQTGFEKLVARFFNKRTGAVSGEKKVEVAGGSTGGEGVYWKYESFLKKQSARMYSLTGAAGELIAVRKDLFKPLPADAILDDLQLSLDIIREGKLIDYEPGAFATEPPSQSLQDEFRRKVRISAGVFQTLSRNTFVFNPFKHSVFVFQFFSHRILRWTISIVCLLLLLLSNIFICLFSPADHTLLLFFQVFLFLQSGFYLLVILGLLFRNKKLPSFFFLPFYFIMMNSAIAVGFIRFLQKKESVMWKKAAR
jgi:biofilm PGA synthesis N-glycosyltransferase PgaC